ncbi:RND family efflux transporter, MFP subunit [Cupriavidus sp. YR651]|uniref:efflux RND transporter periplasmic adaptor subunit n=1 Tax=Cupriavidus sp. YR651 TaxID=1855315 RepID=UPI000887C1A6|nr:HlyD family secretion protein [Cupriavidus sp. YR651]SDD76600.1 RND family efflux transporter, MFP subunit [Cupriavidus sp. YR651]
MKQKPLLLVPVLVTLLAVICAVPVALHLWDYYKAAPWTRDGHVRADVVQISPDVSGLVTQVLVKDNAQVHRGQLLFIVDPDRFTLALRKAEATLAQKRATLAQARRELARNRALSAVVATEATEMTQARVDEGEAEAAQALAAVDVARLDLERSHVVAPVDGYLNDRLPRVGDYVVTGKPALSMVDKDALYVEGYFEETKLARIHVGDAVDVRLMGESTILHGVVQSLSAGIEDRDRSAGSNLLPNVNPTFNWVRLAQRIPVRVVLQDVPQEVRLISGRTASVWVREAGHKAGALPAAKQVGAAR